MERGIAEFDDGRYELALIEYRKAYEVAPKNAFVNYEMALAYYNLGNIKKAQEFAKVAAKEDSESGVQGVVLLGTIYDEQGNTKKSIKTYEKAIKRFGDYYLLWFNLGVTYSSMADYDMAAKAFMKSANNRLDHTNSHYALASMMQLQGRRAEAMLPLYFFLMLEPNTDRSLQAATTLSDLWSEGVSRDGSGTINIDVSASEISNTIESSEIMVSMIQARTLANDSGSVMDLHKERGQALFPYLSDLEFPKRNDFYTQYYIPVFGKIGDSQYMEAFINYVFQAMDPEAKQWVNDNTESLEEFFTWLDEND
ncbi:MAG: hypothetical protein Salg2KO_10980 [Salibacteraceae bacterium]